MKRTRLTSIAFYTLLSFLLGEAGGVFAQDIHFSQFSMTPLNLNPALTGFYSGDHRAYLNYKSQWTGMGSKGATYRTYMCSYDTRLLTKKFSGGYIGAGFNAFKDIAGDLSLGTTQFNLSVAGIVSINSKQLLSGGIQGGIVQKSINSSAMQWDEQYDPGTNAYNSSLPSNDVASIPSHTFGDFSGGIAWNYNANKSSSNKSTTYATNQLKFNLGLSAFHLNKPNQNLNPFNNGTTDNLYAKFIIHGTGLIPVASSKYQLMPSFAVYRQGPFFELNAGTMVRWIIKGESRYTGYVQGMALSLGAQYRYKDAVIPMALFEYSDYALGLSYDVNTSSLRQGTRGKGGIEISLRYIKPLGISSTRLLD